MAKRTPQNLTPRVGFSANMPASVRRNMAGSGFPDVIYGDTIEANTSGKLDVRIPANGLLKKTSRGLEVDGELGDKNLSIMKGIKNLDQDISASYTEAEVQAISDKVDEILDELKRTKRMRNV